LAEGVNPSASAMTVTQVTSTAKQYGNYAELSDQLFDMGVDNLMAELSPAMGQNGGESVEQIIVNAIDAGTNVIFTRLPPF
jgi:N4-gp56 family major capsid protein